VVVALWRQVCVDVDGVSLTISDASTKHAELQLGHTCAKVAQLPELRAVVAVETVRAWAFRGAAADAGTSHEPDTSVVADDGDYWSSKANGVLALKLDCLAAVVEVPCRSRSHDAVPLLSPCDCRSCFLGGRTR
jgi:hypothetical protein